jgi:hypothetical protein
MRSRRNFKPEPDTGDWQPATSLRFARTLEWHTRRIVSADSFIRAQAQLPALTSKPFVGSHKAPERSLRSVE